MHLTTIPDIPVLRTAPPELARLIDGIEPGARLLYAGQGRWRMWRLAQSPIAQHERRITGIKLLDGMLALDGLRGGRGRVAGAVTTALMALRGYVWEWDYEVRGEPNSSIADDFKLRVWAEQRRTEAGWDAMIAQAAGDDRMQARIDRAVDYTRLEGPSKHRWAFRKPVSIVKSWD